MAVIPRSGGLGIARPLPRIGSPELEGAERRPIPLLRPLGRAARLGILALLMAMTAALGIFQVLQTANLAEAGYELRALENERAALAAQVRALEAQVAQAARIAELREEAAGRLGMVAPEMTLRVAVDVPAPARVPVPARYVPSLPAEAPLEQPAWWERLIARMLFLD